jgi:hypothetical protein
MIILLAIRYILVQENKRRDREPVDETYDEVYIEDVGADGEKVKRKVDKVRAFLPIGLTWEIYAACILNRNFWT